MKLSKIALALLAAIGAGCAGVQSAPPVALAELPNCFDASYERERGLFTIRNDTGNPVNQQCLLTVGPRGGESSPQRLAAGRYRTYLSNGGGGGAGGTLQTVRSADTGGGGGGGGGGAGAMEMQSTVTLAEGVYKLTIGAGGPGGSVCQPSVGFSGGPGWLGSPSNMIRVDTGEVVIGAVGADSYVRPSRADHDRKSGARDGHGGSGYGQASGGHGETAAAGGTAHVDATAGASSGASRGTMPGGGATGTMPVADKTPSGSGGGGGASAVAAGGDGGRESPRQVENRPERGLLGSGGGGGEGNLRKCEPGARGGHGYIAFRQI